jgi:hypothetical protein
MLGVSPRAVDKWEARLDAITPLPDTQAILDTTLARAAPEARARFDGMAGQARTLDEQSDRDDRGAAPTRVAADRSGWDDHEEGLLITMSAERARDFLAQAEQSNLGPGTIDQLTEDVRQLAVASQDRPFPLLLPDLVTTQDRVFTLLEGRQKPEQSRELYLLAGIVSGFLAKASHDVGAAHEALTQTRAAYACADNAGHDGLRAWIRGLQALITYWAGRYDDSVRYTELGADAAARSHGTSGIWLHNSAARALAAAGRIDDARTALNLATDARDHTRPDELDELGSICTFSLPTQLYYAADALAWGGPDEAADAERQAVQALAALREAPAADRGGFGNEQGALCDLAVARLRRDEPEGAAEALRPVLELPVDQRQQGIVRSVERVGVALRELSPGPLPELGDAIEVFLSERLALPK